ncbi:hypothetical protein VP1G_10903, partial [Cytospora mali]
WCTNGGGGGGGGAGSSMGGGGGLTATGGGEGDRGDTGAGMTVVTFLRTVTLPGPGKLQLFAFKKSFFEEQAGAGRDSIVVQPSARKRPMINFVDQCRIRSANTLREGGRRE